MQKIIQKIRVDFFKTTKHNHFSYVLFYSIFFFAGAEKKKRNQKEGE
jgi:hypothetical protein